MFDYGSAAATKTRFAPWKEMENRSHLWDRFVPFSEDLLPEVWPVHYFSNVRDPTKPARLGPQFDWGPLPDSEQSGMSEEQVCVAVAEFLDSNPPEPFFCAAGLWKPHLPWYAPQRFFDLYALDRISLPFVKADDLDDVPAVAKSWAQRLPNHETILAHGQWRHAVQAYLASISYCDSVVDRIVEALGRSKARDVTLVVLWGDNGFHLGEKLHWRKFVLWEEATRVPVIMVPSRLEKWSARAPVPVSFIDIFPSLFEMIGLPLPDEIEGESLLRFMRATGAAGKHPAVSTWRRGNHSIRVDDWRYTRYADGGEELYDQDADPYEWNNLIGDPRFEDVRRSLREFVPRDIKVS